MKLLPIRHRISIAAACYSVWCIASGAVAQVVAPSTFTTGITVQGEAAGTEFDDWAAAGVPVVDMDPEDNPGDVDIANIQIANDNDFIYIHATTHNTTSVSLVNLFLAFDVDQDKTTGFDVLQIGEIGSEFAYQNDYPFAQDTGVFNLGLSITGGPTALHNGGALTFPFWTGPPPEGIAMEWKIGRDVIVQYPPVLGGPAPAIPNPSFDFVVFTDQGLADISQVISYTLATGPTHPGDFDNNLAVDGNDVLVWQRKLGTTLTAGDLTTWRNNFPPAAVAAIASVPEPTGAALGAILLGASAVGSRRRLVEDHVANA